MDQFAANIPIDGAKLQTFLFAHGSGSSRHLAGITDRIGLQPELRHLHLGADAAGALRPGVVRAVVLRGGRPDLAGPSLPQVVAPTLFMVGGDDTVPENRRKLEVVEGATHVFEEPGALAQLAAVVRGRFREHLGAGTRHR